jgi:hypothetical protein
VRVIVTPARYILEVSLYALERSVHLLYDLGVFRPFLEHDHRIVVVVLDLGEAQARRFLRRWQRGVRALVARCEQLPDHRVGA